MKAARVHGIRDVRIEEVPEPFPAPGEVLLRVPLVTICASDLHVYLRGQIGGVGWDRPFIPGHEFAGVVLDPNGTDLPKGTRVAVDPAISCGKCDMCLSGHGNVCRNLQFCAMPPLDGAMRERIAWRRDAVFPVPDSVDMDEIPLLELLAIAVHSVELADMPPGATVAVLGCGGMGLCILQAALAKGAARALASDLVPERVEIAKSLGADLAILAAPENPVPALLKATGGHGADVVFEAAGAVETPQQAIEICKPAGKVVLVGIPEEDRLPIRLSDARRNEIALINVRRQNENYAEAVSLAASGKVKLKPLLTHRFALEHVARAYEIMETRADGSIRIGIEM